MMKRKILSLALHGALLATVHGTASAQEPVKALDSIQVTGSRIKRVDAETASPLQLIDREAIERSGALTIGDFLQDIPAIAGAAINPAVNNGGGDGSATISLRGLGEDRTLLLVNGRRIVNRDINAIPMTLVASVEVLKDGASAIYGSDAVGGVVNFILKSNFEGAEVRLDWGISARGDGQRHGASATWGTSGERGNLIVSANRSEQHEVRAADRAYSRNALSLGSEFSTDVVNLGSSAGITGRYDLVPTDADGAPLDPAASAALVSYYGCDQVTRIPGQAGTGLADFRCFDLARDAYNYQAAGNLQLTPQERTGVFVTGNFDLGAGVTAYMDAFASRTRAAAQIAPLPLDGQSDGLTLSRFSQYNPFGVDVQDLRLRLERLGNRRYEYDTDVAQINAGLNGGIGETGWSWDFALSYGRIAQDNRNIGYLDFDALAAALGPSQNGVCYTDGSFGTPIPGCVPVDFVGAFDAGSAAGQAQTAALQAMGLDVRNRQRETLKGFQANVSGELAELANGSVLAAFGVEYRHESLRFDPAAATLVDPAAGYTCGASSELCSAPTRGSYTVKEAYAEALVPISAQVNLIFGTRWSDYSTFGDTLNSKIGLEWRPSGRLLLRGTHAQVFRAPSIRDLYGGDAASADTYSDPCNGILQNGGGLSLNPACANIVADGSYSQRDTQLSAIKGGNAALDAEQGTVTTAGFLYEPGWLPGTAVNVDFWRMHLDDAIGSYGSQNILNDCFNSSAADPSPLCALFSRRPDGTIDRLFDRRANKGSIDTSGVDLGLAFLRETRFGEFRAGLEATYIGRHDLSVAYQDEVLRVMRNAGSFLSVENGGEGNFSRWRAAANAGWRSGPLELSWNLRHIGAFRVGSLDPQGPCANRGLPPGSAGCQFRVGALSTHNLQAGYRFPRATLRIGIDNAGDKQPPLLYQNNTVNGNTDERTFDTVGRYYWTSLSVDF